MRRGAPPRRLLDASEVLEGLEPDDVKEAVEQARFGRTKSERIEAMARVIRRRRQRIARVREEEAFYSAESRTA